MQIIYTTFLSNHPEYQQLQYIAANGDELVRVYRTKKGAVQVAAKNELRNQSGADDLSEAIKLAPGEIYYSNVSLNREHNVIQVPHLPTMRMATPFF